MIKVTHFLLLGALLVGALLLAHFPGAASAKDSPKLLEFDTMIGVPRPYTGSTNAIRGISGGGLPWVIGSANGELNADGKLEVTVKGLVFDPNDTDVINRGLANQNTVAQFRAIVSCLSTSGGATTVNVSTDLFPATTGLNAGDAKIEAQLSLPSPCIAPVIFVTNPAGAWFAATGG